MARTQGSQVKAVTVGLRKIGLFSGRFDPVHTGHIVSLLRLTKRYRKLIIVILWYKNRRYPACLSKQIIEEVFSYVPYCDVKVYINRTHFGKITKNEMDSFGQYDEYIAGNFKVLEHMESMGIPTYYTDRAYLYRATNTILKE